MFTKHSYDAVKKHYDETKPIRGRKDDIRPAGTRRKDWMQVVKSNYQGVETYGYKFYNTTCVEYLPTTPEKPRQGIVIRHGGWETPVTAEFITAYSPFSCVKRSNRLWVLVSGWWVPIVGNTGEVRAVQDEQGDWIPDMKPVTVRRVDRSAAKELRKRVDHVIHYCTSMLKLSDGWVTRELNEAAHQARLAHRGSGHELEWMISAKSDDELLACLGFILPKVHPTETRRLPPTSKHLYGEYEHQFAIPAIIRAIHKIHDAHEPRVYKYEKMMPTTKPLSDVCVDV